MNSPTSSLTEHDYSTILAIADTFFPAVEPSDIVHLLPDNLKQDAAKIAALTPSKTTKFLPSVLKQLNNAKPEQTLLLVTIIKVLGSSFKAPLLTGSVTLFRDMAPKSRESVLLGWRSSYIGQLRKLYMSLHSLFTVCYLDSFPGIFESMSHPVRNEVVPLSPEKDFQYKFISGEELDTPLSFDAIIVGSGSGAGVAARKLCREGLKVLVIEKGNFFHPSELNFNENEALDNLYDNGGALQLEDNSMSILAGSTFGGGSTVNWSASLKTTDKVRKEWAQDVPWYSTNLYDEAMDAVCTQMGVSTEHIGKHSFANQTLIDGCKKLEFAWKEIPQNTGNSPHECGLCALGCTQGIKQGGVVNWLRDAAEHGCQFLIHSTVLRIIHKNGRASGVAVLCKKPGEQARLVEIKSSIVIVASGALHTPPLLLRSGFKNKNIGKGLTLHPSTVVTGDFPENQIFPAKDPIMTSVCTEFDDLDGQAHGPKLETLISMALLEAYYLPFQSGKECRVDLLHFNNYVPILVITRDKGYGKVSLAKSNTLNPKLDYSLSTYDLNALREGSVRAAELLYIQGASRILPPVPAIAPFECKVPIKQRTLKDADFLSWLSKLKTTSFGGYRAHVGSAHQMSSCKMSTKGPSHSVANERGKLWECENVYITDTSVFPSASGVNPMISVMATAHVISQFIVEDFTTRQGRLQSARL